MAQWDDRIVVLGRAVGPPAVAMNQDGRIEVYWREYDAKPASLNTAHCWQTDPTDPTSWTSPTPLAGTIGSRNWIEAATDGTGRIHLFWCGLTGLLHVWAQAGPNVHDNMIQVFFQPGQIPFTPAVMAPGQYITVAQNDDRRLECFYQGFNGCLYHIWQKDNKTQWSDEFKLGDDVLKSLAERDEKGQLNVFSRGSKDQDVASPSYSHIYSRRQRGGNWENPPEQPARNVNDFALARNADGRVALFFSGVSPSRGIHVTLRDMATKAWQLPVLLVNDTVTLLWAGTNKDGLIELFFLGGAVSVYSCRQTSPDAMSYTQPELAFDLPPAPSGKFRILSGLRPILLRDGRMAVVFLCSGNYTDPTTNVIAVKWTK